MAAILSTLDAAVNTGALCLARDVYQQILPRSSGRRLVAAGRWSTLVVGGAALAVAFRFQDILKTLGLASQIMAEGLFIPGMAMLFLKKKLPAAGLLSLLLGGGFSLLSFFDDAGIVHLSLPDWPRSVPVGMALSAAGFIVGSGISIIRGKRRNPWPLET
jgi:SSS family solute:Na+ symporter